MRTLIEFAPLLLEPDFRLGELAIRQIENRALDVDRGLITLRSTV